MAQQQQNITIAAPGFNGVNTMLSPLSLGPDWAKTAENCVIDSYGRVGARKGWDLVPTTDATELGSAAAHAVYVFTNDDGDVTYFTCGNNKIMTGTTTLVDVTPVTSTITADDWQIVELNNNVYFIQAGHDTHVWNGATDTLTTIADHASASGTPPTQPACGVAGFGKLWLAVGSTLYWSDTLLGMVWTGGSTGSIDLETVWTNGHDTITAVSVHNGFLIIFGTQNVLIYGGAEVPSTMALSDTIRNIGCVARDSVRSIGTDLLFLDANGVRSLGRVIQEKSSPIGDISANVTNDVIQAVRLETGNIVASYSGSNGFYLLSFPTSGQTFCFDFRNGRLPDGSARTTVWLGKSLYGMYDDDVYLYLGTDDGMSIYGGTGVNDVYLDNGATYRMKYYSHPQSFGSSATLKFPKQLDYQLIGGAGLSISLAWGFGYTNSYEYKTFTLGASSVYEYGTAEYGEAEYVVSAAVGTPWVNTWGSGKVVTVGLEATINGQALSVQEINMQTLIGRIV